jgi:hypothetical protein
LDIEKREKGRKEGGEGIKKEKKIGMKHRGRDKQL